MPEQITNVRMLLAGPGDVTPERDRIDLAVRDLNATLIPFEKISIELFRWETHVVPGVGETVQAVVERQLGTNYSAVIIVLWTKLGAGTLDEFRAAIAKWRSIPESVDILVYFKDSIESLGDLNLEEYSKIAEFRRELGELGVLYNTFKSVEEIDRLVRLQLPQLIAAKKDAWKAQSQALAQSVESPVSAAVATEVVEGVIVAEEDEGELGYLDYLDGAIDAGTRVANVLSRQGADAKSLGDKMTLRTQQIESAKQKAHGSFPVKQIKSIANKVAKEMVEYANRQKILVVEFGEEFDRMLDYTTSGVEYLITLENVSENDPSELLRTVSEARASFVGLLNTVGEAAEVIAASPSLTREYIKARAAVLAVMDELSQKLREAVRRLLQLEDFLDGLGT